MNKVKLIVGAPGAGKTTYAQKLAEENGGRVVDLDQIRSIAPDEETARAWRDVAEEKAHESDQDVYIVRTLAKAEDRAEVAERLKADETIVLLTSAEIAKARVTERDGNDDKHTAIDEWWNTYTANDGETVETFDGDENEDPEPPAEEDDTEQGDVEGTEPDAENESEDGKEEDNQPDLEKLLAKARAEERAAVQSEYGTKLFNSSFTSAAALRGIDADRAAVLLKPLNAANYLTETGDINTEELNTYLDALAPVDPKFPSSHGGYRKTEPSSGRDFGADRAEQYLKKGF